MVVQRSTHCYMRTGQLFLSQSLCQDNCMLLVAAAVHLNDVLIGHNIHSYFNQLPGPCNDLHCVSDM